MLIDRKDPSAWTEDDLNELCVAHRREKQGLEFKRELDLDSSSAKKEVEKKAISMANGGGGIIVYGIEEVALEDGGKAAGSLRSLADGGLYERLNSLLDDRGTPRLSFHLHHVSANGGGMYLVLDISGRRRPHRANNGRYYGRRGTSSREMTEAEVAEAYRDRFLREANAFPGGARAAPPIGTGILADERVHRGLSESELAIWREETGEHDPPGWMSTVVAPSPTVPRIVDPIGDRETLESVKIENRWEDGQPPFRYFQLVPGIDGLKAQLPPNDEMAPGYLIAIFRDGVMEYGTTMEPALRDEDPSKNRMIATLSHPFQAHDYLLAFGSALHALGYDGDVEAGIAFYDTRGTRLGLSRREEAEARNLHPLEVDQLVGDVWNGPLSALPAQAGLIVKQAMDEVYLAAGMERPYPHIDNEGHRVSS